MTIAAGTEAWDMPRGAGGTGRSHVPPRESLPGEAQEQRGREIPPWMGPPLDLKQSFNFKFCFFRVTIFFYLSSRDVTVKIGRLRPKEETPGDATMPRPAA